MTDPQWDGSLEQDLFRLVMQYDDIIVMEIDIQIKKQTP